MLIRERLHQPWWDYDDSNTTDVVSVVMESNTEDFSDLYAIVKNETVVSYTCPYGYIFEGTNDITVYATCSNWNWTYSFNTSFSCARKFHSII